MTAAQPSLPATSPSTAGSASAPASAEALTQSRIAYIQQALNSGFSHTEIAQALGVTPSAITQICQRYDLVRRTGKASYTDLDNLYDELEMQAAKKLKTSIATCDLDPVRMSAVLHRINGLKRRSMGEQNAGGGQQALVQLSLPQTFRQNANVHVVLSAQNEVVSVDGRTIATMQSSSIEKLNASRKGHIPVTGEMPDVFAPTPTPTPTLESLAPFAQIVMADVVESIDTAE